MCCFSRPIRHVSQTHIFARSAPGGRQVLVYSMNVSLAEDVAMILPLPTPEGAPEDAVRFLDLSGYPAFFRDLQRAFPVVELLPRAKGLSILPQSSKPRLRVHAVGEFEASFVPSLRDFDRLDERFRLPAGVWDKLPQYRDDSFAVFKLRRPRGLFGWLRRLRTIHPMAMDFPRRDPRSLFFPTVHVHDGALHPKASFDHSLYCQPDADLEILLDWERSEQPLGRYVDERRSAGVVSGGAHVYRRVLLGPGPNRDTVIDEAGLRAGVSLGEHFLLRARGMEDERGAASRGAARAWPELSPAERGRIQEALTRKLSQLARDHRDDWGLSSYRTDLPERWPTYYEAFPDAGAPPRGEPCRIKFFVWTQRIEPQEISLAFRDVPSRELREAIHSDLQAALDEIAAGSP